MKSSIVPLGGKDLNVRRKINEILVMKIVYCINQLENIGGIQRITIAKANALSEIQGNEVTIVAAFYRKRNSSISINPCVKVIDLDVHYYEDHGRSRIGALLYYNKKRKEHKHKLEKALNNLSPDVVISVGGTDKNFLPSLKISSHPVFIREMHFHKYYRRVLATGFYEKFLAMVGEFFDYHFNINKYDRIVVLTEEDRKDNWKNNPKVVVIPNPITEIPYRQSSLKNKVVIAAGGLVKQKNFPSLISAWVDVNRHCPDWKLKIFGDGEKHKELQNQIDSNNLSDSVLLCGFTDHIFEEMADASIFVLSSLCEGFGLVLIEAMSCGLPVVSYDCPCGPKDIITNGQDGILIPFGDEKRLAEGLITLMFNESLRKSISRLALMQSRYYYLDRIIDLWMNLLRELVISK